MGPEAKKEKKQRLGEMLIQSGLITTDQLNDALKIQQQTGSHIGSILVEQGYIDIDKLLSFLAKQFSVPAANLQKIAIQPSAVKLLPFEKLKEYKVLPLVIRDKNVTLAMVNPSNFVAISDLEFLLGESIQPVVVLSSQVENALKMIECKGGRLTEPLKIDQVSAPQEPCSIEMSLKQLFRLLIEEEGSDLLLSAGVPPCLKKDSEVRRLAGKPLTPREVRDYAYEVMSAQQREEFEQSKELDFGYTFSDVGRFRINVYQQRNSVSIAVRNIVEDIPSVDKLGIGSWIEEYALKAQGLILITGPVGHGKTTTLAALVDIINTRRKCNIITIEDPIEFYHKHKASNVNQREVGVDTASFHEGLRHVFREAPDVIVIGEMRDPESFSIALQAAETGHLVMSTLHSNTATSTIDRIIDIFPQHQQQQVRVQFADNFVLVLNQRLVPRKSGTGRVLAYEKLINTYRVRNLIREGKAHQIRSMLQQSTDDFLSIDHSLARLCSEGKIHHDAGLRFCENQTFYNELVSRGTMR